jgi:NADH-quinone oxidoreductase subunit L
MRKPGWAAALASSAPGHALHRLWRAQWGLDWLYDLFVFPVVWLANANRRDNVDRIYDGLAWSGLVAHRGLSRTQTGLLRWYAAGIAAGSLALVALVLFL